MSYPFRSLYGIYHCVYVNMCVCVHTSLWILDKVASDKVASDKVASDKVASGQSSLLRKVASTVNKGHGRSARPPSL